MSDLSFVSVFGYLLLSAGLFIDALNIFYIYQTHKTKKMVSCLMIIPVILYLTGFTLLFFNEKLALLEYVSWFLAFSFFHVFLCFFLHPWILKRIDEARVR